MHVELADFLAQRIAVKAEQLGRPDLIATRRSQCRRDQWWLDLAQNAVIEARRRDVVAETAEILGEVALDRA